MAEACWLWLPESAGELRSTLTSMCPACPSIFTERELASALKSIVWMALPVPDAWAVRWTDDNTLVSTCASPARSICGEDDAMPSRAFLKATASFATATDSALLRGSSPSVLSARSPSSPRERVRVRPLAVLIAMEALLHAGGGV